MIRALVKSIVRGSPLIALNYPLRPNPRWGFGKPTHPRLTAMFAGHAAVFRDNLQTLCGYRDNFLSIAETASIATEPSRENPFFAGLDALSLYGFLRQRQPRLYIEIGSGNSTKFAAKAIRDGATGTRIVSIDPNPRAEIDSLAQEIFRQPLEDLDLSLFSRLQSGDLLFFDGSHLCLQNSDVVTFFLDLLPELPTGVLVHVHDIKLPFDYQTKQRDSWYSEQYMLAMYLLSVPSPKVVLPNFYVWSVPDLRALIEPSCRVGGSSFWFES